MSRESLIPDTGNQTPCNNPYLPCKNLCKRIGVLFSSIILGTAVLLPGTVSGLHPLYASESPSEPPGPQEETRKPREFQFFGDSTSINLARGRERTILTGNARIISEDREITADRIEIYGTDFRYAVCTGNVNVVDRSQDIRLTSSHLHYDRETEVIRVEGYSEMVDMKNEIVLRSGFLENSGRDNITIAQIGVRVFKISENSEIIARAEYIRYDQRTQLLELSGFPVVNRNDDIYRAGRITMDLETDEITLHGEVSGTIRSEGESR